MISNLFFRNDQINFRSRIYWKNNWNSKLKFKLISSSALPHPIPRSLTTLRIYDNRLECEFNLKPFWWCHATQRYPNLCLSRREVKKKNYLCRRFSFFSFLENPLREIKRKLKRMAREAFYLLFFKFFFLSRVGDHGREIYDTKSLSSGEKHKNCHLERWKRSWGLRLLVAIFNLVFFIIKERDKKQVGRQWRVINNDSWLIWHLRYCDIKL